MSFRLIASFQSLFKNRIFHRIFRNSKEITWRSKLNHNGFVKLKSLKNYSKKVPFFSGLILSAAFFTKGDSPLKTSKLLEAEADLLYQEAQFTDLYEVLKQSVNGDNAEYKNSDIYWRLARAAKEMANLNHADNSKAKAYTYEAFEYAKTGLELDSENWACNKWYGILLDLTARYEGTKKRIENSYKVKEYLDKASRLNPKDATTIHSLGVWCYEFAALPWYQKKIAAAIFATPPTSSFEDALKYFLAAESVDPGFYSYNLLYLGKCYHQLNDLDSAKFYLNKCIELRGESVDDRKAKDEAKSLLKKIA